MVAAEGGAGAATFFDPSMMPALWGDSTTFVLKAGLEMERDGGGLIGLEEGRVGAEAGVAKLVVGGTASPPPLAPKPNVPLRRLWMSLELELGFVSGDATEDGAGCVPFELVPFSRGEDRGDEPGLRSDGEEVGNGVVVLLPVVPDSLSFDT